ncbi:MAG: hypothetical protein NZM26_04090 [Patescibacteria group bacterium]|nr:hypothetical protein [Patescibacteria group bacterium]
MKEIYSSHYKYGPWREEGKALSAEEMSRQIVAFGRVAHDYLSGSCEVNVTPNGWVCICLEDLFLEDKKDEVFKNFWNHDGSQVSEAVLNINGVDYYPFCRSYVLLKIKDDSLRARQVLILHYDGAPIFGLLSLIDSGEFPSLPYNLNSMGQCPDLDNRSEVLLNEGVALEGMEDDASGVVSGFLVRDFIFELFKPSGLLSIDETRHVIFCKYRSDLGNMLFDSRVVAIRRESQIISEVSKSDKLYEDISGLRDSLVSFLRSILGISNKESYLLTERDLLPAKGLYSKLINAISERLLSARARDSLLNAIAREIRARFSCPFVGGKESYWVYASQDADEKDPRLSFRLSRVEVQNGRMKVVHSEATTLFSNLFPDYLRSTRTVTDQSIEGVFKSIISTKDMKGASCSTNNQHDSNEVVRKEIDRLISLLLKGESSVDGLIRKLEFDLESGNFNYTVTKKDKGGAKSLITQEYNNYLPNEGLLILLDIIL